MSLLSSTLVPPLPPKAPYDEIYANSQTCSEFKLLRNCNLFSDYFWTISIGSLEKPFLLATC